MKYFSNLFPLMALVAFVFQATAGVIPQNLPIASRGGVIYYTSDLAASTVVDQVSVPATATNILDAALAPIQLISLTTNTTVVFSNLAADRKFTAIYYNPLGTSNSLTFPSGVVWMGNPITNLLTTKRAVIDFYVTGTSNETVVANPVRQP
jgi:hypothetical protein